MTAIGDPVEDESRPEPPEPSEPPRILLDTNVVIMRPDRAKLTALGPARLMVAAITYAELAEGEFAADPAARLRAPLDLLLARQAYGPGLPFDDSAAQVYPAICRAVIQSGRALGRARRIDMMIAAIALANGCGLATRNTDDFSPLSTVLTLIDL
ncbi:MAG: hypothetical protein LBJ02_05105 [Bifidobacteriaceae bacterium]|nr:hypothetical protein [Bifidobacteriaceae bacterium]